MPLAEGQVQVRDLLMGDGTLYDVQDFNPFNRVVRAGQSGPRAWNHGTWSGAEWMDEAVVPIPVIVNGATGDTAGWLAAHQQLAAAFAPVGDSGEQVELRFTLGGSEYVMFGRPRIVAPDMHTAGFGYAPTRCAMVCQDPRIYSGTLHEVSTGLPTQTGGLTVPLTVPFVISGVLDGGRVELVNAGTTDTGLTLRIDGPVIQPRVAVQRPDGEVQTVRFQLDLGAGQWLDIDTASRTALLNGLPESNQRGRALWDIDPFPVAPGVNLLRFNAGGFNETSMVSARWRSAWW